MEKGGVARPTSSLGGRVHKKALPPTDQSEAKGIQHVLIKSTLPLSLSFVSR